MSHTKIITHLQIEAGDAEVSAAGCRQMAAQCDTDSARERRTREAVKYEEFAADAKVAAAVLASTDQWDPKGLRERLCQQQAAATNPGTRWTILRIISLLDGSQ